MTKVVDRIFSLAVPIVIIAIVAGGAYVCMNPVRQKEALLAKHAENLARIENTERAIAEYRLKQQRFRTDAKFVEQLARERHRVFPGELVFVFDDTAK